MKNNVHMSIMVSKINIFLEMYQCIYSMERTVDVANFPHVILQGDDVELWNKFKNSLGLAQEIIKI